jgi:hydrogenase nickel incorporation protein HypA/HybF
MHEVGIAASVLDAVRIETARRPGARAIAVAVRIGALAGIDPESLRFGFDALVKDSDLEPLRLEIETAAVDELDLAWIEVEEP